MKIPGTKWVTEDRGICLLLGAAMDIFFHPLESVGVCVHHSDVVGSRTLRASLTGHQVIHEELGNGPKAFAVCTWCFQESHAGQQRTHQQEAADAGTDLSCPHDGDIAFGGHLLEIGSLSCSPQQGGCDLLLLWREKKSAAAATGIQKQIQCCQNGMPMPTR